MVNPIKQVYKFNKEAQLLSGYSDELESAFPIEEALEGFNISTLSTALSLSPYASPKELSREIIKRIEVPQDMSDLDRLDKHLDIIVFSLGSLFKLGLDDKQVVKALNLVMNANMKKVNAGVDSNGKLQKPVNWPEIVTQLDIDLQDILDSR
jgi:hypothetical protein